MLAQLGRKKERATGASLKSDERAKRLGESKREEQQLLNEFLGRGLSKYEHNAPT